MRERLSNLTRADAFAECVIAVFAGLASVALAWRMLGAHRPDLWNPWAGGDGIGLYAGVKAMQQHGWYTPNSSLAFPFGQDLSVFPNLDLVHVLILKLLSLTTSSPYLPVNIFNLWSFFAIGASCYLLLRYAGARRLVSVPLAISVSLAPWHFERLSGHYFLADYSPVIVGLFMGVFAVRCTREAAQDPTLTNRRLVAICVALIAAGFYTAGGGLYWAFSSVLVIAAMTLPVLIVNRTWRGAAISIIAVSSIPVFALTWLKAQQLLGSAPDGAAAFQRKYIESEMYGGSIISIFLGSPFSGIEKLAESRTDWQAVTQLGTGIESWPWNSLIGITAVIWTLVLIGLAMSGMRGPQGTGLRPRARTFGALVNALNSDSWPVAFLLLLAMYAVTGLGSVTMFLFFTEIRTWGRFFVGLMIVATIIFGVSLTHLTRRHGTVLALLVCAALGAIIYADQVRGAYRLDFAAPAGIAQDSSHLVDAIERTAAPNCGVLTLPVLAFPESWPIVRMQDYDPLWLYVESNDLAFTYGIPKNLPQAAWQDRFANPTSPADLRALRATGICGISIDTYGYEEQPPRLIRRLAALTGHTPIQSPTGRWVYVPI